MDGLSEKSGSKQSYMYGGEGYEEYEPSTASTTVVGITFNENERLDLALREWAVNRIDNLGKNSGKIIFIDDIVYDPLSYVVTKYVNMPCGSNNQLPTDITRKHLMLDYKKMCREGVTKGSVRIYKALTLPVKDMPDTCKLLPADLAIFFASTPHTMSLCMLPQITANRAWLTPEFFQQPDWRDEVKTKVRQIPPKAQWEHLKKLLDDEPISKTKPFTYPAMEKSRLAIVDMLNRIREAFDCALDPCYPHDDRRLLLLQEVERKLVRVGARIVNINDVGLDGMGGYEDVNGERRNDISWIALQTMGQYSVKIRRHFGIRNLYDPFE